MVLFYTFRKKDRPGRRNLMRFIEDSHCEQGKDVSGTQYYYYYCYYSFMVTGFFLFDFFSNGTQFERTYTDNART